MKKNLIIVAIWILFVCILNYLDLVTLDVNTVKEFVSKNKNYALLLFIALWIIRLLFLIPGTTLMILAGVCFSPIDAFLLSTVGIVVSESLVYVIAKSFAGNRLKKYLMNRHSELNGLLETHNYKFLALGIICPIAPADVICFLSASVGIKYFTYMITIIIASTPLRILYSYIGSSLTESTGGLVFVIGSLVFVFAVSIKIWNSLKKKQKNEMPQS
ncbi:TVP38/TMEM64 family protein [Sporosarcina sp. SAFN-010]|uniref:TVP38/TMEM64 family protein n=1 Tax=Sporosarcina sp. SAFN-010 TaxID=3387273 RepID=UPI003F8124B4